ncbi:MAG: Beta-lactamase class C-like and penicillin binding proteins (PBPs) superfamily [uncultured Thermomicrobiales bacterium]|uniref:Beta-lactamase class C-like and penicillin binding proteins (PBPs) superfamily n=1 Tax=uncultured Thermomicrobiales bacterium TaxID=1645740 RepID=A0A6J4VGN6_9BACT|nr:MAG: Beta-lactamase class C-like and penicillin binding proteins (PBPs) superfamily [uncultured Thermomicrobiales bacterium]
MGSDLTADARVGAAFGAVLAEIDDWVEAPWFTGCGAAVWFGGRLAAVRSAGEARPGVPVDERTLFPLASVTKPVSAAAVLALVEEGRLGLDDPVARHLPSFVTGHGDGQALATGHGPEADPALEAERGAVTVRQLLAHLSGLPEDLTSRDAVYHGRPNLDRVIDAMCGLPLRTRPGAEVRYSNAGYGVLARLTERVGGEPFWDLARDRVLDPLGLRDTVARPGEGLAERLALLGDPANAGTDAEAYNSPYWRALGTPWAGLYGTPRDLARFAGLFLPGGIAELDEVPLAAATRAAMVADQAGGVPGGVESGKVRWPVAAWGLGWEVKGAKENHWTGTLTSPRTFCHFGQAGTLLWGDPDRDVALAVFANRTVTRMWRFILARWVHLSDAVVATADAIA